MTVFSRRFRNPSSRKLDYKNWLFAQTRRRGNLSAHSENEVVPETLIPLFLSRRRILCKKQGRQTSKTKSGKCGNAPDKFFVTTLFQKDDISPILLSFLMKFESHSRIWRSRKTHKVVILIGLLRKTKGLKMSFSPPPGFLKESATVFPGRGRLFLSILHGVSSTDRPTDEAIKQIMTKPNETFPNFFLLLDTLQFRVATWQ